MRYAAAARNAPPVPPPPRADERRAPSEPPLRVRSPVDHPLAKYPRNSESLPPPALSGSGEPGPRTNPGDSFGLIPGQILNPGTECGTKGSNILLRYLERPNVRLRCETGPNTDAHDVQCARWIKNARACETAGTSAEAGAERSERWNHHRHCGWPRSATTYLPQDEDDENGSSTFRPKAQSPQYLKC